jgi:hypothetical protein
MKNMNKEARTLQNVCGYYTIIRTSRGDASKCNVVFLGESARQRRSKNLFHTHVFICKCEISSIGLLGFGKDSRQWRS